VASGQATGYLFTAFPLYYILALISS